MTLYISFSSPTIIDLLQGLARTANKEPPVLGADYSYDPEGLYVQYM